AARRRPAARRRHRFGSAGAHPPPPAPRRTPFRPGTARRDRARPAGSAVRNAGAGSARPPAGRAAAPPARLDGGAPRLTMVDGLLLAWLSLALGAEVVVPARLRGTEPQRRL